MERNINELASYCLNCKVKPCQSGCPLGNDIPEFIKNVKEENFEQAYKVLSKTTVLESICGRICPHMSQCMGKCVRGIKSNPVNIGDLEAFVGDKALQNGYRMDDVEVAKNGKKVAIIGSGPAGLTCAAFLARNGFEVTIYEKRDKLGGLLRYGIPEFRLSKDILDNAINKILNLGIEVQLNTELGTDVKLEDLSEKYDFVFISIGANIPWKMGIEGEDLQGVYGGNTLLEYNSHPDYHGKKVAVIGGGNVAMDCARTINKMGAEKVTVIYRRAEEQMPAEKKEIKDAKDEGVEFLFQTNIVKILGDSNVEKVECIKTELVQKEGDSRLSPVDIEGSNYELDMDYVVMAIGSVPEEKIVNLLGLECDKKGYIKINDNYETSMKNVLAGGDVAGTKSTVAWAARTGRNVAEIIMTRLNKGGTTNENSLE
ncbi:MAG: NAD(P)-dependent oxidoreductase [Clostridia bacterium]|nr:NAD(P)-dependent oxidoreductase [Clostridia bacterium]